MTERLRGRIGMVRVLVSSPEDRVDHVPVPSHLKRLKAFHPFVGGRRAVALLGLIVVHHHGIQAQEDQRRRLQPQPPQEQLLKTNSKLQQLSQWLPEARLQEKAEHVENSAGRWEKTCEPDSGEETSIPSILGELLYALTLCFLGAAAEPR